MVGGAGLLIPPGDAAAAIAAVEHLASDPRLRERFVRAGLRLASQRTMDAEARRVTDFVRQNLIR